MLPMTTHPGIRVSGCRSQVTGCFWARISPISRFLFCSFFALFAVDSCFAAVTNTVPSMEVNHAVMVTVELDLGTPVPSIAEGLRQVERKYQPEDGRGRTFAILD